MTDFKEKLPEWDNPGTEPPNSKKTVGWQVDERPPAAYMNWINNRIYEVVKELQKNATHKDDFNQNKEDTAAQLAEETQQRQVATDNLENKKADKVDLETQKGRIDNLAANAGNTDNNAELLDIRVDDYGETHPTAGDAVRTLTGDRIKKAKSYGGPISDNVHSYYPDWVLNNDGYFKSSFDMSAVPDASSLNKVFDFKGYLFVPSSINDFAIYLKITSQNKFAKIGRIFNYKADWANIGQFIKYQVITTNRWVKIEFSQDEIDTVKNNPDYTGLFYVIFKLGLLVDTGYFEMMALDTRKDVRSGSYETIPFSTQNASYAYESEKLIGVGYSKKLPLSSSSNHIGPGSVNTISSEKFRISIDENLGFKISASITDSGYAFVGTQLTSGIYDYFKNKKVRFFLKSDKKVSFYLKITNSKDGWNEATHVIGCPWYQLVTLDDSNDFKTWIDIDFSDSIFSDFYAAENRVNTQAVNYLIVFNDPTQTEINGDFEIYSYVEELEETTIDQEMISPESIDIASKIETWKSIKRLGASDNILSESIDEVKESVNELDSIVDNLDSGLKNEIVCWGDSLTAMNGWTQRLQELSGLPVYNGGTGGENSRTIVARQGGDVMIVNNITIPAGTDPVLVANRATDGGINTQLGATVTPLLQGGAHVNPCKIGDIEGTLTWTGSSYADMNGTWTFTRSQAGDETLINRPTALRTNFDMNHNAPKLAVIFIGQNGGWTDNADLIKQHRWMIDHTKAKDYIILGLSSGSAADRAQYEADMAAEFGRRFISLRQYLTQYGLDDLGLTPTQDDLDAMAIEKVPPSLLIDAVHFTPDCRTIVGDMLYRKIKDLGIL